MDHLKKKYKDIYLLRNERIFKIYRFSDGRAIEPDFVSFLTEEKTKRSLSLQLFVEPKGQHLIKSDIFAISVFMTLFPNHRPRAVFLYLFSRKILSLLCYNNPMVIIFYLRGIFLSQVFLNSTEG